MKSNILTRDYQALIGLYRKMSPEKRLVAFFNHSRLIHKLYQAGKAFRSRPSRTKTTKSPSQK